MRDVGSIIVAARKAAGLTQRDLAAAIKREDGGVGISAAYLNDIEHNRRTPTNGYLIREIARLLRLDPDYLLLLFTQQLPEHIAESASSVDPLTYKNALTLFQQALRKKK